MSIKNRNRSASLYAAILLAGFAVACAPEVRNHGHIIAPEDLGRIVPGVTSREEVYRVLGSPSTLAPFDSLHWYYVSQRTEQMSFYQSEITNQDVVTVVFDQAGIVDEIQRLDLSKANNIDPDEEKTRTLGNELSVFEQFIGNIGRFSAPIDGPDRAGQ